MINIVWIFPREDSNQQSINISEILANIDELNKEQVIRNEDVFGPVTNETVIIVIQVHNRITYLRSATKYAEIPFDKKSQTKLEMLGQL